MQGQAKPLRIVVTGSAGRLGAAVVRRLQQSPDAFRVEAYDRKAMDLLRPEIIEDHLLPIQFDALVNCAAMTSVDQCEREPDAARQVNALAVGQMAAICKRASARMVHVSTDYVYDGSRAGIRVEGDPLNPLGVYARTKREGEELALAADSSLLVARTSWVFGPDRPSFPDQILAQARRGEELEAIADKFSTPSYSVDLAGMIEWLLRRPDIRGTLNLCNSGQCSWHEYAHEAVAAAHASGWLSSKPAVKSLKLAGMTQFIAPRPIHTAMSPAKASALLKLTVRSWQEALGEYIKSYYAR